MQCICSAAFDEELQNWLFMHFQPHSSAKRALFNQFSAGVAPGIFRRVADSSDEGAKIWFSGYYKCRKCPENGFSPSDGG